MHQTLKATRNLQFIRSENILIGNINMNMKETYSYFLTENLLPRFLSKICFFQKRLLFEHFLHFSVNISCSSLLHHCKGNRKFQKEMKKIFKSNLFRRKQCSGIPVMKQYKKAFAIICIHNQVNLPKPSPTNSVNFLLDTQYMNT